MARACSDFRVVPEPDVRRMPRRDVQAIKGDHGRAAWNGLLVVLVIFLGLARRIGGLARIEFFHGIQIFVDTRPLTCLG